MKATIVLIAILAVATGALGKSVASDPFEALRRQFDSVKNNDKNWKGQVESSEHNGNIPKDSFAPIKPQDGSAKHKDEPVKPDGDGEVYLGMVKIHYELANYTTAKSICEKDGGRIYLPDSLILNERLYKFMAFRNWRRMWIGGINEEYDINKKLFVTSDQQIPIPESEQFWGDHEPNNFRRHNERCLEMRVLLKNTPDRNWNDAPCDHVNHFICDVSGYYDKLPVSE